MSELEANEGKPNLVPMLDMVFQLITFFMLVINFKAAALDLTLRLPVIGSAGPVETNGQEFLILNVKYVTPDKEHPQVIPHVEMRVSGVQEDIASCIAREAAASRLTARRLGSNSKDKDDADELQTTVVIRADQDTPFHLLNRVIKACQDNGFRRFAALKALKPERS